MTTSRDNELNKLKTQGNKLMDNKEELRLERNFLQTIIDSLPYPFYVVDMESQCRGRHGGGSWRNI